MLRSLLPLFLGSLLLVVAGCDAFSNDDDSGSDGGTVMLVGQVLDDATNNPVPGAFIRILPFNTVPVETDAEGRYSLTVEIDSTMELNVTVSKDGFAANATNVLGLADRTVSVPTLRIKQIVEDELVSGKASNILLLSQSTQSIGVKEGGSEEVAQVTFQVADSLGRPVVLDNAALVHFSLGVQPGGGVFIFPESAVTDNNGQVTANLSSGTRAGAVQVIAEATVDGRTIRSLPVSVSIHGGLPHEPHFTVGPTQFNFPGLTASGLTNGVSVIVGDQYANPVRPQTAVYFTTSHGIVQGSVLTDPDGRGTVNLISGNPFPPDGIGVVTATTADRNRAVVTGRTGVVWSGPPVVEISPTVARLGQTYSLRVTDGNNNPLAPGNTITVRVEGTKVKSVGNTSVEIDDTRFADLNGDGDALDYEDVLRGPGITEFTFRAVEDLRLDEETGSPVVESITVVVAGPNGKLEIVLSPAANIPQLRTKDARLDMTAPETAIIHAPAVR